MLRNLFQRIQQSRSSGHQQPPQNNQDKPYTNEHPFFYNPLTKDQSNPLRDPKTRHRLELLVIILIISVVANVILYIANTGNEAKLEEQFQQESTQETTLIVTFAEDDQDIQKVSIQDQTTAQSLLEKLYPVATLPDGTVASVYGTEGDWQVRIDGKPANRKDTIPTGAEVEWIRIVPSPTPAIATSEAETN